MVTPKAVALFCLHAPGKVITANLDDAEKGISRHIETDLEKMKRTVIGRNEIDAAQESLRGAASSTGVDRFDGIEKRTSEQTEKINDDEVSETIVESETISATVSKDDETTKTATETLVAESKDGSKTLVNHGHDRIIERNYETYPLGWPRIASFMNASSTFAIWRRFGTAHNRVLLHLQATITSLEKKLDDLDKADAEDKKMLYRLKRNEWKEGWDTAQKEILEELHRKLLEYDELLLKDSQLRSLTPTPQRDFFHVFNWIFNNKPLDIGQYDFIYHRDDFISSANREKSAFDNFVESCVSSWPDSRLIQRFLREKKEVHGTTDKEVYFFSRARITLFAKLLTVCVAITVLLTPVFLLYLIEMSKAVTMVVVLLFVLTFATVMSLLTGAKDESIFIGTCTYAAILVVFLGIRGPGISQ